MASSRIKYCSADSTASRESTLGSAWYTPELFVCELPLPWLGDTLKSRNIPAGLDELVYRRYETHGYTWGLVGCAPDPAYSVPGYFRVMHCTVSPGSLGRFSRRVFLVPYAEMTAAMEALFNGEIHPQVEEVEDSMRDVLLCTHGTVDTCCATFGYPLYALMRKMADNTGSNVRVWRATHFGGHRFAPTFLDLPSGRYWGRVTPKDASALLHQSQPADTFRHLYRGSATMAEPLTQAIEAELLAHFDWALDRADIGAMDVRQVAETEWQAACSVTLHSGEQVRLDVGCRQTGLISVKGHCNYDIIIDSPQYETGIRLADVASS